MTKAWATFLAIFVLAGLAVGQRGFAMRCRQISLTLGDGRFTLAGDSEDYTVIRWTNDEIFARTIAGICRAANVIKFDLRTKKVYSLQTLTEPIESLHLPKLSQDMCKAIGSSLELHAPSVYHVGPTLNAEENARTNTPGIAVSKLPTAYRWSVDPLRHPISLANLAVNSY